jgi:hypothetical protein
MRKIAARRRACLNKSPAFSTAGRLLFPDPSDFRSSAFPSPLTTTSQFDSGILRKIAMKISQTHHRECDPTKKYCRSNLFAGSPVCRVIEKNQAKESIFVSSFQITSLTRGKHAISDTFSTDFPTRHENFAPSGKPKFAAVPGLGLVCPRQKIRIPEICLPKIARAKMKYFLITATWRPPKSALHK